MCRKCPRPPRGAVASEQAGDVLGAEVTAGRLDSDAVRAVLDAAGHRAPVMAQHTFDLMCPCLRSGLGTSDGLECASNIGVSRHWGRNS